MEFNVRPVLLRRLQVVDRRGQVHQITIGIVDDKTNTAGCTLHCYGVTRNGVAIFTAEGCHIVVGVAVKVVY